MHFKNLLEADSIQKSFGTRLVLSDVYLTCCTGEIIGLLGRNGSGKSTLLKILFGLLSPDFKFIRVNGSIKKTQAALLTDISYLPQENFVPTQLSVLKAIKLTVCQSKVTEFCDDDMIRQILNKKISHLSGGELRYLEIKLILSRESKFALLDEPYNGLSPVMVEQINSLITNSASSKGIIITDHSYQNVLGISTRLILMRDGKTEHLKDQSELIQKGYLKAGMLD